MVSSEGGAIQVVSGSVYNDTGSTFKNNIALNGGAISVRSCHISLIDTIFEYNHAQGSAGVLNMRDETQMNTFYNITAVGNSAYLHVGVIQCESNSYFEIDSSRFLNNTSKDTSSIFSLLCNRKSRIINSYFSYNDATFGGTVKSILTQITIENTTFKDNFSEQQTPSVYLAFSIIRINS